MSEIQSISEHEAIRQIIAEGGAMDYVDVVDAVKKRFHVDTSAAVVEQIHQELMRARRASTETPPTKMAIELTSRMPPRDMPTSGAEAEDSPPGDDQAVTAALRYVNAVGGMRNARNALDQLERLLQN